MKKGKNFATCETRPAGEDVLSSRWHGLEQNADTSFPTLQGSAGDTIDGLWENTRMETRAVTNLMRGIDCAFAASVIPITLLSDPLCVP
jgi:hypothetical protein